MNSNKLIIKFKRIENDVFASPINIPDWAKGITISYPENRYKFSSYISQPHHLIIKEVLLYIPPTFYEMNFTPRHRFDDTKKAENWINYMNDKIEKLNEEHNMIMKNEKTCF